MSALRHTGLVVAILAVPGATAAAQFGEVQVGLVASYGSAEIFGPGAGAVLGVTPGGLAYIGLRWTYHAGFTEAVAETTVTNRVQAFAVDLAVRLPAGRLDIVPGLSLGALRFSQQAREDGGARRSNIATEFSASPGLAMEIHGGGMVFIPQLQYCVAGNPDLRYPTPHNGFVASIRIAAALEIRRIRHF
jgi:hypothetical protein